MFPLQSFKVCITSMQTSSSMEIPNTDKECLKYLETYFQKTGLSWLLKNFPVKLLPMIIQKIYTHIGNTHLEHTNKNSQLGLKK